VKWFFADIAKFGEVSTRALQLVEIDRAKVAYQRAAAFNSAQ
jgi:hypothetical protein